MTPEERRAAAEVMASEGPWQHRGRALQKESNNWLDCKFDPVWDWNTTEYRVRPKPEVRYTNVYSCGGWQGAHKTREDADKNKSGGRIACVRIEFFPGQYDE